MPDALVVSDGVTLGVWLVLPEDVGVGDGEQTFFIPKSKIPRNGVLAVQVVPASVLIQLARTFAAPPEGTAAAPTLYQATASDEEMTSAYVIPRTPDVSKTIDDIGTLVYAGAEGRARDGTTEIAMPCDGAKEAPTEYSCSVTSTLAEAPLCERARTACVRDQRPGPHVGSDSFT